MSAEAEASGVQTPDDLDWQDSASCRSYPQGLWFDQHTDGSYAHEDRAKKICRDCPVRSQCHDYALHVTDQLIKNRQSSSDFGIAAAMTPDERRKRLRAARREGVTLRYES